MNNFIRKFITTLLPLSIINCLLNKRLKKKFRPAYDDIKNNKDLIKDYRKSIYSYAIINRNNTGLFIKSYNEKTVRTIKMAETCSTENEPIMICAVKNELKRIKLQIEYHKKIGVKHFAYIDNASDDGTFQWLKEQPDVSLFYTDEKFHPGTKNSWRRQITDILGYNRWYLILDADELFAYPGIEAKNIRKYIDFLEKKKIKCAFAPMIDMYSINRLFDENTADCDILGEYCYFDTDTYKNEKQLVRQFVTGGPRERLFGKSNTNSKYPLIKLSKEMIAGTHENHPYKMNYQTEDAIAFLMHYKFLSGDKSKYIENATSGLYGSDFMYKLYMKKLEENPDTTLFFERAQKLNSSMDLLKINLIDKKFFKQFLKE